MIGYGSVFSKHVIDGRDKTVRWQVTMRSKGFKGLVYMGVMDARYIERADVGEYIGEQKHQIALIISHNDHPYLSRNGSWIRLSASKVFWNVGGRAKLEF